MNAYEWSKHEISKIVEASNDMLAATGQEVVVNEVSVKKALRLFPFTKGYEDSLVYVTCAYEIESLSSIWEWVKKEISDNNFSLTVYNIHRALVECISYNPRVFNNFYRYLTNEYYEDPRDFVPDKVNVGLIRKWVSMYEDIEVNTKNDKELKDALRKVILNFPDHPSLDNIYGLLPLTDKRCAMAVKMLLYLNGYNIISFDGKLDEEFYAALHDFKKYRNVMYAQLADELYVGELKVLFNYRTEDGDV